jgi:hypothetical protein
MIFLGQKFREFRVCSFYIEKALITAKLILFFQSYDLKWFSLTIGEGEAKYKVLESEPKILDLEKIEDDFAYPIQRISNLDKYLGKCICSLSEYRLKKAPDLRLCVGVYFDCGDCGFSVTEDDDDGHLHLYDEYNDDLLLEADLVKI